MTKKELINRLELSNMALRIISTKLDYMTKPYTFSIGDTSYTITRKNNDYQIAEGGKQ